MLTYSGSKQTKKNLIFTSTAVKTSLSRKIVTCNWMLLSDYPYKQGSTTLELNPLKTKRRLFYLKTQYVPRSKHFSSRL